MSHDFIQNTKQGGLKMDRKSILKKFEDELRESHQNYLDGKGIPWKEFDWGLPMRIAETRAEYRIQNEA